MHVLDVAWEVDARVCNCHRQTIGFIRAPFDFGGGFRRQTLRIQFHSADLFTFGCRMQMRRITFSFSFSKSNILLAFQRRKIGKISIGRVRVDLPF